MAISAEVLQQNARNEIAAPWPKQQSLLPGDWEQAVLAMLGQTAEVLGAEMTARQYDAYLRLLEGVPVSELAQALDRCMRERTFMPKPAEILAAAGRSPEALADKALAEALAWVREWGPSGRKAFGEPKFEFVDTHAVRLVKPEVQTGPPLPFRTVNALARLAGDSRRGLERLLTCADDPDKYARFRREFQATWREC